MYPSIKEIQRRLKAEISQEMDIPVDEIDSSTQFASYGLDSMAAVNITLAMEDWLDLILKPNLPFKYRTISSLSEHLFDLLEKRAK